MRRSLFLAIILVGVFLSPPLLTRAYAQPPKSWTAYRIARAETQDKPPETRIQIWSAYLEEYPDTPYRHRVLDEIDAASLELWSGEPVQPGEDASYLEEAADALGGEAVAPPTRSITQAPSKPRWEDPPAANTRLSRKRPLTAGFLSLASTFGGMALANVLIAEGLEQDEGGRVFLGALVMGAALTVGPSVGHMYAGDKARARRWSFARLLVGGTSGALILLSEQGKIDEEAAVPLAAIGGLTLAGMVAVDLVDSFFVVQRKQRQSSRKSWVGLVPSLSPLPNGNSQAGLRLVGSF